MSRFRKFFVPLLAIAIVGAATGGLAFAQTTGDIQGTVTDTSGAALPGVTCTATSPSMQGTRTSVTSNSGSYRISTVPPGTYKVSCGLAGFATAERTAVVTLGSTPTVNHTLQISQTEEVVVSGQAPVVDTGSTTTGSNYSAKVMEKLPLGRNYAAVVKLQPGVNEDTGDQQGRGLALSVYGSTSAENVVRHRRHQHDERQPRRPGQDHQQRVHPGGRGQDRRLPGRVRPLDRRHHQRHHEVGRKRVPRRRLRATTPRRASARIRCTKTNGPVQHDLRRGRGARLRRRPRRLLHQGPPLVLHGVQPLRRHSGTASPVGAVGLAASTSRKS